MLVGRGSAIQVPRAGSESVAHPVSASLAVRGHVEGGRWIDVDHPWVAAFRAPLVLVVLATWPGRCLWTSLVLGLETGDQLGHLELGGN